jgi:hypothetical protein
MPARLGCRPALLVGLCIAAWTAAASSQDTPPAPAPAPASAPAPAPAAPGKTTSRRPYASGGTHLALERGLCWLSRHQDETGRWSGATCAKACLAVDPKSKGCQPETALELRLYSTQADVGLTSLALLAFIRAGQGEDSTEVIEDPVNKHRLTIGTDVVRKGLQWVVSQQRPDGSFSDDGTFFLYNEAVATLMLCEAYALGRREELRVPAQKAVAYLCKAQKPNPTDPTRRWGWRYLPAGTEDFARDEDIYPTDADMSVTGWMVMALKSAKAAGLEVPQASLDGALDFTRWSTAQSGLVGYLGPDSAGLPILGENDYFVYHLGTMSSIGMCVGLALTQDAEDPFLAAAAERLVLDLPAAGTDPAHPQIDYYYWYYGALALNQFDGPDGVRRPSKYSQAWNKVMTDTIIGLQDRTKGACSFGGWMRPDRWSYGFGPVYTTAISVLGLEVCYRY